MKIEFKKFFSSIAYFVLFSVLTYVVLVIVWGEFFPHAIAKNISYKIAGNGHLNTRIKELKTKTDIDILFLGSSHCYRGFDTRIFEKSGLKCFNMGSSAQTPIQTKILLDRYLDRLNPKTVVYEVYPKATLSIDGVESALDLISNDRNDFHSIRMALGLKNIKVFNTLLYAFYRDLFNRNKNIHEPIVKEGETYIPGGFVEKKYQPNSEMQIVHSVDAVTILPQQVAAFTSIINTLKQRNAKVILAQAPYTKTLYHSFTNNRSIDSLFRTYGEYYNFNELMSLNDSLNFYDAHHLNQTGVDIFDNLFLKTALHQ